MSPRLQGGPIPGTEAPHPHRGGLGQNGEYISLFLLRPGYTICTDIRLISLSGELPTEGPPRGRSPYGLFRGTVRRRGRTKVGPNSSRRGDHPPKLAGDATKQGGKEYGESILGFPGDNLISHRNCLVSFRPRYEHI